RSDRDWSSDVCSSDLAVYSPAITDFIVMVDKTSYMFITGPDVIKTVTHEEVTKDQLGGAMTHNETSGVAHFMAHDDAECLSMVRSEERRVGKEIKYRS